MSRKDCYNSILRTENQLVITIFHGSYQRIQRGSDGWIKLYLVELGSFDDGVGLGDLLPAKCLEIEAASMLLRVPVGTTVDEAAPALEPRKAYPPPARRAPVRP